MAMRGVETRIQEIRHRIFTEVARMAYHTEWPTDRRIEALPFDIMPGEVGNIRNDIFLERAIVGERLRLAMGLPCRSAAEHAPLSDNIEAATREETYYTPPLINVIKFACHACKENEVMVTDGCQGCMAHPCVEVCPKGAVSLDRFNGRSVIDQEKCIKCGRCMDVCQYHAIIRQERPCAAACGMDAIHSDCNGRADIDYEKCVSCGQCLVNCPFGAIADKSQIFQMIRAIQAGERVYAAVAPAFVGQFGPKMTPGKLRAAMKRLGFADIIEVAIGADLCAAGGRGLCRGSTGEAAVHGDFLLPGVVDDGKEAVPGTGQLHLDGAHPDDPDRPFGQAPSAGCKGGLYRPVCGKEARGDAL